MTGRGPLDRLGTDDWVIIGYVVGLAVYYLFLDGDEPEPWTEQDVRLGEEHLQRLEDGDTLELRRWHGQTLAIDGTVVVDVEPEREHDQGE